MPTRTSAPVGAPCWVDLWTPDVEGSRAFYQEVFGWEVTEPEVAFGGYFNFVHDGRPVAGAMGDMGTPGSDVYMAADNRWTVHLATEDIAAATAAIARCGGVVSAPAMQIADLGWKAAGVDPSGASFALWQAGTHPGFVALDEPGAPSWFELHTPDHPAALDFYREVCDWKVALVSDTDVFRYAVVEGPGPGEQVAGVMDSSGFAPAGSASWAIYWHTDDVDATVATVTRLGGSVTHPAEDTPYGRLAAVTDPAGAEFKLRNPPAGDGA